MKRRLLLAVIALAVPVMRAVPAAVAGTYQVQACAAAFPAVNNSWEPFNNNATYLETSSNCGVPDITEGSKATSGLAAADVLQLATNVPAGALAGWRITAPAGEKITAVTMDRDLYDQAEGWSPQIVDASGNPLPGETCPAVASEGGCEASGTVTHTALSTTSLAIELLCHPEPVELTVCGNGFSQHFARVELNGATVTITDEQPPEINSMSGSLFAGELERGTLSGTIQAADGSGVQATQLYVDGRQVAQQPHPCDFTHTTPCPATASDAFSLDTSSLPDGPHQIQAAAVDAAGNQTLASPVQITVQNTSPRPPDALQVNASASGTWINRPATITWMNAAQPSGDPISQVNWIACAGTQSNIPPSGCNPPQQQTSPLASLTFNPAQDPAYAAHPQGTYTVFVWLQDAIGNTTAANASTITFGYQTSPPPTPTSIKATGQGPFTIALGAAADIAPLTATNWIACNHSGACTPTQTSPGLAFVFDPAHTPLFQHAPFGSYTIRAWLQDAAGNTSFANSAILTVTFRSHSKPSPQLHILSLTRSKHTLHTRGSAAQGFSERITIVVHYLLGGRVRTARKTITATRGQWAAGIGMPAGSRTLHVTLVHHTTTRWRAQTVTRYVHHRARSAR